MHKAHDGHLSSAGANMLKNTWVAVLFGNDQFAPNPWLWRFGSRKYHDQKGLLRRRSSGKQLLTGNRGTILYTISLKKQLHQLLISVSMAKASPLKHERRVKDETKTPLVEAARTMLSASKLPLFFWAEAIATACYTQNRSIIIPTHEKTAYHIINDRKPSIKHLHIFGCTCYLTKDSENLDKMKEKGDPCILVGYSTQSKGYRVFNKRTRLIVESIHLRFDEIKEMSETSDC
ncbi:retrovirus-related pol polyprotein from transposon TNT 1-94 [Tanacetum coccineum]